MSSSRLLVLLLFAGSAYADGNGFLIGGGIESDTEDGLRGSFVAGAGLGDATWVSGAVSQSAVELQNGRDIDTLYADAELDHFFDPVGFRVGVSYWGDSDILDSNDWRASLYVRGEKVSLGAEYEFRDFDFIVPSIDLASVREFMFDADGIGLRARIDVSDNVRLSLAGKSYDYSVDFLPDENRDVARLFTVSRLSLINSLISSRASLALTIDRGLKSWELNFATWEGEIDRSRTNSFTVRYLTPIGNKTDIGTSLSSLFSFGVKSSRLSSEYTYG